MTIWKFSKSTTWSRVLNIYASVRSEAFGAGHDHPDIALAMGLVMPLRYSRDELEAMLGDRIRQADLSRLSIPIKDVAKPIHALCGFKSVTHEDRSRSDGGRCTEDIFDSLLRHTRRVPREVIGIGGAIYAIVEARDFETVRTAVNSQAGSNIDYAAQHSFLGWSDLVHRRFAAMLTQEVIDAKTMGSLAAEFGDEGPKIIKFLIHHGLLGFAEPLPQRHRHYYLQRFAFDEVHGQDDSSSVNKDFFFLHPAFKEWILSLPEKLNKPLERLQTGIIGDLEPYEAMPPMLRLGVSRGQVAIRLRTNNRMLTPEMGATSDPLRLLFVALWACREARQTRIDIVELRRIWAKLGGFDQIKSALQVALPSQPDLAAEKLRDWAKKINRDPNIRQLQRTLMQLNPVDANITSKKRKAKQPKKPFISVSAKSSMGSLVEIGFFQLPLDELDWYEILQKLANSEFKLNT